MKTLRCLVGIGLLLIASCTGKKGDPALQPRASSHGMFEESRMPNSSSITLKAENGNPLVTRIERSRGEDLSKVNNGVRRIFYPSSQLRMKGRYKEGQPHGTIQNWFPTGVLKSQVQYRLGLKHGDSREYYENGALRSRERYAEGILHGRAEYYLPNKKPYARGSFWNQQMDGLWEFFDSTGRSGLILKYERGLMLSQEVRSPEFLAREAGPVIPGSLASEKE